MEGRGLQYAPSAFTIPRSVLKFFVFEQCIQLCSSFEAMCLSDSVVGSLTASASRLAWTPISEGSGLSGVVVGSFQG